MKPEWEPWMKWGFVLRSHVRSIGGQTMMLEPGLSGDVVLPNDEDTKKCVEAGWLKVISEPFMAEPAYDVERT